jgi:hypothetical protein
MPPKKKAKPPKGESSPYYVNTAQAAKAIGKGRYPCGNCLNVFKLNNLRLDLEANQDGRGNIFCRDCANPGSEEL